MNKLHISSFLLNIIAVCLIIYLLFFYLPSLKGDIQRINNINLALKDSVHTIKTKTESISTKLIAYGSPKAIENSDAFKTLSKNQQDFYNKLNKVEGLVGALHQEILVLNSIKGKDSYQQITNLKPIINDSNVCFKINEKLVFQDSSNKHLQYKFITTLGKDSATKELDYKYTVDQQLTWVMQKDKSIKIKSILNDSSAVLKQEDGLIIPYDEQGRNGLEKWIKKNEKWIEPIKDVAILIIGMFLGSKL